MNRTAWEKRCDQLASRTLLEPFFTYEVKTMKKTIRMKIKIKDAEVEFKPGLGIGVIVSQDMTYNLPEDFDHTGLALSIQRDHENLLHKVIEFVIEEIDEETSKRDGPALHS